MMNTNYYFKIFIDTILVSSIILTCSIKLQLIITFPNKNQQNGTNINRASEKKK